MSDRHLAQVNIARLIAPLDDPRIHGFTSQLSAINQLAESSPGFVWRSLDASGEEFNGDPLTVVNISVWESPEALKAFTYKSTHLNVFRQRRDWFRKLDLPHYCLWWVPAGHTPDVPEARARLELYPTSGPTPESFWFTEA